MPNSVCSIQLIRPIVSGVLPFLRLLVAMQRASHENAKQPRFIALVLFVGQHQPAREKSRRREFGFGHSRRIRAVLSCHVCNSPEPDGSGRSVDGDLTPSQRLSRTAIARSIFQTVAPKRGEAGDDFPHRLRSYEIAKAHPTHNR
jgi:hypothetical protein